LKAAIFGVHPKGLTLKTFGGVLFYNHLLAII